MEEIKGRVKRLNFISLLENTTTARKNYLKKLILEPVYLMWVLGPVGTIKSIEMKGTMDERV